MAENFSWHTDEDKDWDELTPRGSTPPPKHFRWPWFVALFAAAFLISLVLYLRLQQQVREATTTAKEDLLAAHQLNQQAAATQDLDLFRSNLSRRDPVWSDTQRALVMTGLFFDRSAFGLRWWGETDLTLSDAAATPTRPITITLAPDLLSAEIVYEQEYLLLSHSAISQTVRLQHTAVYRRGSGRWLLADPLPEFWGDLISTARSHLTLSYSQRDEAIALRLADDLNDELIRLCVALPALECPTDLHLNLRLTRDPASFFSLVDLEDVITAEAELILPAPTLVGLPLDEAGYQAMVKGYAAPLAAAAISRLIAYECCYRGYFYHAFMYKQLSELGLQTWPMTPDSYAALSQSELLARVVRSWGQNTLDYADYADLPLLYSLVDYLTTGVQPPLIPLDWLRELKSDVTFIGWLENVLPDDPGTNLLESRWLVYNSQQQYQNDPHPLPLPGGQVQMSCNSDLGIPTLFTYDIDAATWDSTFLSTGFYEPWADGHVEMNFVGEGKQLVFIDGNNQSTVITTTFNSDLTYSPDYSLISYLNGSPPEGFFTFATYGSEANSVANAQYWLADLDQCDGEGCMLRPLSGTPTWSPDGQHLLLTADDGSEELNSFLYLTDNTVEHLALLGTGYLPFWLDETHYGFFRINEGLQFVEMWIGVVGESEPKVHLTSTDILPQLEGFINRSLLLAWLVVRPHSSPPSAVLLAISQDDNEQFVPVLLTWDENWETIQGIQVIRDTGATWFPFYSPDGQYLILLGTPISDMELVIIDLATGTEQNYTLNEFITFPFWSDDGQWLIQLANNEILLVAPSAQYIRRIPHTFSFCNRYFYVPEPE